MNRRAFLRGVTGTFLASPAAGYGLPGPKVYHIGLLGISDPKQANNGLGRLSGMGLAGGFAAPPATLSQDARYEAGSWATLAHELAQRGYVEGRNLREFVEKSELIKPVNML